MFIVWVNKLLNVKIPRWCKCTLLYLAANASGGVSVSTWVKLSEAASWLVVLCGLLHNHILQSIYLQFRDLKELGRLCAVSMTDSVATMVTILRDRRPRNCGSFADGDRSFVSTASTLTVARLSSYPLGTGGCLPAAGAWSRPLTSI